MYTLHFLRMNAYYLVGMIGIDTFAPSLKNQVLLYKPPISHIIRR